MLNTFAPKLGLTSVPLSGLAALALLSASPAVAQHNDAQGESQELTEGEQKLADMLEGRVAGEPQDCIADFRNTRLRTIEETAYVYGRGRTIYVQRTRAPEDIDRDDVLITRRFSGTRLCRLDTMTTVDRTSGFFSGVVHFEQFVPYTKVDEQES